MTDRFDVVVLGSLHFDILINAPRLPALGETLAGTGWRFACGGKGGNQAVAAAQIGARTAMVGRVGDDDFGRKLLANLDESGVDRSGVGIIAIAGSGMSVAITEARGDYAAVIVSGSNLDLQDVDAAAAAARVRPNGVLVLQNEVPEEANLAAARAARAAGATVVLNAAPARPFATSLPAAVDVVVVNEVEAVMLGAEPFSDAEGMARAAARLGGALGCAVVVTAGPLGAAVVEPPAEAVIVPARPVSVVSTHGAGDVLIGALAAALAGGATLPVATRKAVETATHFVSLPPGMRRAPHESVSGGAVAQSA